MSCDNSLAICHCSVLKYAVRARNHGGPSVAPPANRG